MGEFQPTIWTRIGFRGLASPFGVASHCTYHCCARVAQKIRSIQTYRCLHLPLHFWSSSHNVLDQTLLFSLAIMDTGLARCLTFCKSEISRKLSLILTGHLTARADDGHALPLGSSGKPFRLSIILPSLLVRFSVLNWIKPHAAPLVVLPRQFL